MNKVLISIMIALVLIYISNFLINVKEGMRRSKEERKDARTEKKEARTEKHDEKKATKTEKHDEKKAAKEDKKEARTEKHDEKKATKTEKHDEKKAAKEDKKETRTEKHKAKKEARTEKHEAKKEARTEKHEAKKEARTEKHEAKRSNNKAFATSEDQDVLSDQLCTQISKNQFSNDAIDVANLNKVIEELKREDKINNANKDTILKYIQHIRVLKLRINNEILYKTKFSDVFNFGDDDGTDQDIVSVLSNVDSAIKKKTDVINQLNILEKSLIDHYNYHKRLLGNQ
jgi:hypothetical protein